MKFSVADNIRTDQLYISAIEVVRILQQNNYEACLAGGSVRDMVMGANPVDYDIATSAIPQQVIQLFPRTVAIGAAFGVVVVLHKGFTFEVATFRAETSYTDGRRPDVVTFTSPEDDVKRRDFTINGLLFDPFAGKIMDYVGGIRDIENRVIRSIGNPDERFMEDHLRILRAIRFSARFDFAIEKNTLESVGRFSDKITRVSMERIRDEIEKIITSPGCGKGLRLLVSTGILNFILPEIADLKGVEQNPLWHPEGDVLEHVIRAFESIDSFPVEPVLAWALLFHDVGKKDAYSTEKGKITFYHHESIGGNIALESLKKLRLSRNMISDCSNLIFDHMKLMHIRVMKNSTAKKLMARKLKTKPDEKRGYFILLTELNKYDNLNNEERLEDYKYAKSLLESIPLGTEKPAPLLGGDDLIELGFVQGPLIGEVLKTLSEGQLDGLFSTREDAIAYARKRLNKLSENV
ncbi:MAG: CCA tRNA nucleotidyltransferase [Deltaproteobacteria bacterium]|nr:CCA tRNA nucleotidyltransferase [Deltaproteobacteria bacterium]